MLALALVVIAVPNLLARDLRGELDDSLRRRAADVARLNATVPTQLTETGALEGGGLLVQVVDRSGRIVARSSALGGRVLPVAGAAATGSPCSPTTGWAPTRSGSTRRRWASSARAKRRAAR